MVADQNKGRIVVLGTATLSAKASMTATLSTRTSLSLTHIRAAAMSARLVHRIETHPQVNELSHGSPEFQTRIAEQRAHTVVSVIEATAFLEATINQFLADVADGVKHYAGMNTDAHNQITSYWNNGDNRDDILEKFQNALNLLEKSRFDKGACPYQDTRGLVKLKNHLVHYKPIWVSGDELHNVEELLRSKRFPLNPLVPNNNCYPERLLHHACAKWAIETSIKFVDAFYAKIDVTPPYNNERDWLHAES
ncbi:hypothetical protein [Nitrolancea hollandica]|uniref:Uncharacterized protein n=1 Tax=Nitrolancea hollandica Lb TaxID=1129897 RepID=I4EDQ9_9BACT|nr:hypothetical protein [Nitrolancea hollandica]CCF82821.1 hypothetical protein NITHO_1590012 [Nitrolancea hollandica Lb]